MGMNPLRGGAVLACLLLAACGRGEVPASSVVAERPADLTLGEKRAKLQTHFAGRAIEPTLLAVSGGHFAMGCAKDKECRFDEKPVVEVTVAPFALSRTEVTFEEWDACFADGGCLELPPDRGWGRQWRPVINVSWNDAQQYIAWLNKKTGKAYRLPSEAEFEYALRAGSRERFWTGPCIFGTQANFDGRQPAEGCPEFKNSPSQTVVVASYAPNGFGLHDLAGNVAEWVNDCWFYNYKGMQKDGRRKDAGNCSHHAVRGGSWYDRGDFLRSASRDWFESGDRVDSVGFRLAL